MSQQPRRFLQVARSRRRTAPALLGAVLLSVGLATAVVPGSTSAGAVTPTSGTAGSMLIGGVAVAGFTNPTANGHSYRHGAVPRIIRASGGHSAPAVTPYPTASTTAPSGGAARTGSTFNTSSAQLLYGGGTTAQGTGAVGSLVNAGVTTGQPQVYLVFFGSQWGSEGVNGSGQATFSGDPQGEAPLLQTFYTGLGSGGELWSGTVTQYCDGVPVGAKTCATGGTDIPYPTGGVLAGIWYDNSAQATSVSAAGATGNQLAAEAEAAALHFGNLDQASNRDAQYVIASPTGTNPDGWANPTTGYCAYHDDTHDPTIDGGGPVDGPIVAFTNLPYVSDAGYSCGAGLINSPGTLDGLGEATSHEYAETLTDQFPETTPPGGWSTSGGAEIGDLCAYVVSPSPGSVFNLVLGDGTVPVQGLWSNAANSGKGGCVRTSPVFSFVPKITSFTPLKARVGAKVTIAGTALLGATSVDFNGARGTVLTDTSTKIVVLVPAAASSGPITVTTHVGTATSATNFLLSPTITSFSPTSGPIGTVVTVTGTGLGGATKVVIGGKAALVSSDTATQIVATVAPSSITGRISVKTTVASFTTVSDFTVT